MEKKHLGIILIAISIVLFYFTYSVSAKFSDLTHQSCPLYGEPSCPFTNVFVIPAEGYVYLAAAIILAIIGVSQILLKPAKMKALKRPSDLTKEESALYDLVVKADGTIFQSDLVEKSGMSKVKVTRVLDRLEGKGAIERRRRGMTNVVLLKQNNG